MAAPDQLETIRARAESHGSKRYSADIRGDIASDPLLHDPTIEEVALSPYGFVRLSPAERHVLDHPACQRLRRVAQLGGASHVFPGAEHSRFPHSLGTLAAATRLMDAMDANYAGRARVKRPTAKWRLRDREFTEPERVFVRLAALLHDIAHIPFGHTIEDELGLLAKHDSRERISHAAKFTGYAPAGDAVPAASPLTQRVMGGGSLAELLSHLYEDFAQACWRNRRHGLEVLDIVLDLVASDAEPSPMRYRSIFEPGLCREILTGAVSADVLDYLPRDQIASGVHGGRHNPRLLQYLVPMQPPPSSGVETTSRLVIDLGSHLRPKMDAVTAVIGLLDSRYEMTQVVYRHPVKAASAAMLDRVLGHFSVASSVSAHRMRALAEACLARYADEDEMLRLLAAEIRRGGSDLSGGALDIGADVTQNAWSDSDESILELLSLIALRRLHKVQFVFSPAYRKDLFAICVEKYSGAAGAASRLALAERLESDFDLRPGDVVVYSSGPRPGMKNPDVWLALDGDAVGLLELDKSEGLTAERIRDLVGLDFSTQQEKFKKLGRFEVLLSNAGMAQLAELRLLDPMGQTIEMAMADWDPALEERRQSLAERVALQLGRIPVDWQSRIGAARHGHAVRPGVSTYSNGMPALWIAEET